jgi:hypothetical protein
MQKNILMQSSINPLEEEGVLTQRVFSNANPTVFLDLFAEEARDVWGEGLRDLFE